MPGSISSLRSQQPTAISPIQKHAPSIQQQSAPAPSVGSKPSASKPKTAPPIDLQKASQDFDLALKNMNPSTTLANAAHFEKLGLTPEILLKGKHALKSVSQRQVLNIGNDSTVIESGRSVKLAQGGTQFGIGIALKAQGQLDIVGHGSPDGKTLGGRTPQQLAQHIQRSGVTELAVIDLKSCHSQAFKAQLQQCLEAEGIQVGEIKSYEGEIAISRGSGKVIQGDSISSIENDGTLVRGLENLKKGGLVHDTIALDKGVTVIPFKMGGMGVQLNELHLNVAQIVGQATSQVMEEIETGQLIDNLSEFSNLEKHQARAHDATGNLHKIVERITNDPTDSFILADFGYLVEDRITQILKQRTEPPSFHFQVTMGSTRPDVVVQDSEKKNVLVDITASASAGHILDKSSGPWNHVNTSPFEITYTSFDLESVHQVIAKSGVSVSDIDAARAARQAEKLQYEQDVNEFITDLISHSLTGMHEFDFSKTVKAKETICEKLGLKNMELSHFLKKYSKDPYYQRIIANTKVSQSQSRMTPGFNLKSDVAKSVLIRLTKETLMKDTAPDNLRKLSESILSKTILPEDSDEKMTPVSEDG